MYGYYREPATSADQCELSEEDLEKEVSEDAWHTVTRPYDLPEYTWKRLKDTLKLASEARNLVRYAEKAVGEGGKIRDCNMCTINRVQ